MNNGQQQSNNNQWTQNPDGTWMTPDGKTVWQNADGSWQTSDGWYMGASGQWQYYGTNAAGGEGAESAQLDEGQSQWNQHTQESDQVPASEESSVADEGGDEQTFDSVSDETSSTEVDVPPPTDEVKADDVNASIPDSHAEAIGMDTVTSGVGESEPESQVSDVSEAAGEPTAITAAQVDQDATQLVTPLPQSAEPSADSPVGEQQVSTSPENSAYPQEDDISQTQVMSTAPAGYDYYQSAQSFNNAAPTQAGPGYPSTQGYGMPQSYTPDSSQPYGSYGQYPELDEEDGEKSGKGSLVVIILLAITLVALIAVGVYLYFWVLQDDSNNADTSQVVKEQSSDKGKNNKDKDQNKDRGTSQRDPIDVNDPNVKHPAPDDALSLNNFIMPSGNIECQIGSTDVGCSIIVRDYAAKGMKDCPGKEVFSIHLDHEGAQQECELDYRAGGQKLQYGRTAVFGEHACESQEVGLRCWNVYSGKEFFLAREKWSAN